MSNKLAELLDHSEVALESAVNKLEKLSGWQSKDIQLLADVNLKARTKLQNLGFEPDHTHGLELYHALMLRFESDEKLLLNSLGLTNVQNPEQFTQKIAEFISHADMHKNVLSLKRSTAKNLLKKNPPKKLMKQLNYRSVDSLLKRENIASIFGAIDYTESGRWHKEFWRSFSKLSAKDFENRPIEVISSNGRWQNVINNNAGITNVPALGAIMVWSSPAIVNVGAIGLSLLLTQHINTLRTYSAYIKMHQVNSDFDNLFIKICKEGLNSPIELGYLPVSWKTIFRHFGNSDQNDFQESFESHITQDDVMLHDELKTLAKLSPAFSWWANQSHVAADLNGEQVSLNIMDMVNNHAGNLSYKNRSLSQFRNSLWHELIDSYMEHSGVKRLIADQAGFGEPAYEYDEIPNEQEFMNSNSYAKVA